MMKKQPSGGDSDRPPMGGIKAAEDEKHRPMRGQRGVRAVPGGYYVLDPPNSPSGRRQRGKA